MKSFIIISKFELCTNKKGTYIEFRYWDDGIDFSAKIKKSSMGKISINIEEEDTFKSSGTFKTSKFSYKNHNYKYKLKYVYGLEDYMANYFSNDTTCTIMKGMDILLNNVSGLTLKDIGFKKCK